MYNTSHREIQALFKFEESFYTKLKLLARKEKTSMKAVVEKHLWPVINERITIEDELPLLDWSVTPDPELSSIGIRIDDKDTRMKTDKRFAELSVL